MTTPDFIPLAAAFTAGAGVTCAYCSAFLRKWIAENKALVADVGSLSRDLSAMKCAEARRQAQRLAASARAKETAPARAAAKRAKEAAEAPARITRTLEAFASTPMRSRAQVVAPVKRKRTLAKQAAMASN